MSEENSVELPIQDVGAWQEAATQQEHGTDRPKYGSDQKGLEQATSDRIQRRREVEGDAPPTPVIKHVAKESKSPWKMAEDVAFSKKMAIASEIHDADPNKTPQELFDATIDALDPPPVEIKLDDKERGRWEGITQPEAAERLKNWRADQARQQAEEAAALQGQQAEHEARQAQEAEQYEQSVVEQAEAERAAQQAEAEQRHYLAEQARQNSQQYIQTVETAARHEAAQLSQYWRETFPDLLNPSPQQIEALRQTNPARWQAYLQMTEGAKRVAGTIQQVEAAKQQSTAEAQARQQAQHSAAREAAISQHDEAADNYIRANFADIPKSEMRDQAHKTLRSIGLSDAQIHEHYFGGAPVSLRTAGSQILLAKAAAWDRAQQRAAEIRRSLADRQSRPPPVMRPGTAGQIGAAADQSEINDLARQLRTAKGNRAIELGMKLTQAKRARG